MLLSMSLHGTKSKMLFEEEYSEIRDNWVQERKLLVSTAASPRLLLNRTNLTCFLHIYYF